MIIRKRRVRKHLAPVERGTSVVVGLENIERFRDTLVRAGFTDELETGEQEPACRNCHGGITAVELA